MTAIGKADWPVWVGSCLTVSKAEWQQTGRQPTVTRVTNNFWSQRQVQTLKEHSSGLTSATCSLHRNMLIGINHKIRMLDSLYLPLANPKTLAQFADLLPD